ncbi:MAG: regulatory protein RecX [Chloroflexaceae bacterium]|nr:regulatory protein RecX [Chloroflexaceae bacterium]
MTRAKPSAVQAAARYIETRPRSIAEVRVHLGRKGYDDDAIDVAIARLQEVELLDDASFARLWVDNRQTHHPRGSAALRNELYRKGIDRAIIDATLSDTALLGDPATQAMSLGRAALRKYANAPDRATFWRRLGGYLQRRGFTFEVVEPVLTTLWSELEQSRDRDQNDDLSAET